MIEKPTWWLVLTDFAKPAVRIKPFRIGNDQQTLEAKHRMMRAIHYRLRKEVIARN